MKRLYILTMLMSMLAAFGAPAVFAGAVKMDVCHVPPGDPDNFHTIKISEHALDAHLAHGDFIGPCNEVCATLCDDGNACTKDDSEDCEQVGCPVGEPVNCDDSSLCTEDACDPGLGCVYQPAVVCDGDATCNADTGLCEGDVSCPCYGESVGGATWNENFPANDGYKPDGVNIYVYQGTTLQLDATSEGNGGECGIRTAAGGRFTSGTTQAQHEVCYAELLELFCNVFPGRAECQF